MKFEDWYNASEWREGDNAVLVADDAWEHQAERIKELETEKTAMIEGLNDIRHELHEWVAHNPILERVLLQITHKLYELANRPVPPENKQ